MKRIYHHTRKLLFVIIFCLFNSLITYGQEIYVNSFEPDQSDLTANLQGTTVYDQNGEVCALIKINTTQTGFTFDVGSLGVTKVEYHTAQVWLYVPHGIRRISIHHQILGSLTNWNFPVPIEPAKTYIMKLTTDTVKTVVEKKSTMDYVVFSVQPQSALVYLNDELLSVSDGVASKFVSYGTYSYKVEADMYHSEVGKVTVSGQKAEVKVALKRAYGYFEVPQTEALFGASVYVDSRFVGKAPIKSLQLSSGTHNISISKDLYKTINKKIIIIDDETIVFDDDLSPAYSTLNLRAESGADIFVNGSKVGTTSWNGKVAAGAYRIECRKANHVASIVDISASGNLDIIDLTLESPRPIYGSLSITSTPAYAHVEVDGKYQGTTPLHLGEILIGSHKVVISKEGYLPYSKTVTVEKGNNSKVSCSLESRVDVTFYTDKYYPEVALYIDGEKITGFNQKIPISIGVHTIEVRGGSNYKSYTESINVVSSVNIPIKIEETDAYKKVLNEKRREENKAAQKQRSAAHWNNIKKKFPARFGYNITNLGLEVGGPKDEYGYSAFIGIFGTDFFLRLGNNSNAINLDFGGGYIFNLTSSIDGYNYHQIPLYFRLDYNFLHKSSPLISPYLAVEFKNYFNLSKYIKCASFGVPIKLGFAGEYFYTDIYYEPTFTPYKYFNKEMSGYTSTIKPYLHRIGIDLGIVF